MGRIRLRRMVARTWSVRFGPVAANTSQAVSSMPNSPAAFVMYKLNTVQYFSIIIKHMVVS